MGDRGHLRFVEPWRQQVGEGQFLVERQAGDQSPPSVWVYSHNLGHDLPGLAARAITAARSRWGDPTYGTRMAIAWLGERLGWDGLGWGIGAGPDDTGNGGRVVEIDMAERLVVLVTGYGTDDVKRSRPWTFGQWLDELPMWGAEGPTVAEDAEGTTNSPETPVTSS